MPKANKYKYNFFSPPNGGGYRGQVQGPLNTLIYTVAFKGSYS